MHKKSFNFLSCHIQYKWSHIYFLGPLKPCNVHALWQSPALLNILYKPMYIIRCRHSYNGVEKPKVKNRFFLFFFFVWRSYILGKYFTQSHTISPINRPTSLIKAKVCIKWFHIQHTNNKDSLFDSCVSCVVWLWC